MPRLHPRSRRPYHRRDGCLRRDPARIYLNGRLARRRGRQRQHGEPDRLMRPIRITTNGGVWVWSAEYTPFGAMQSIYPTATTMDLRFPGQWFQLENGLHYNWHRHYDASTGRYVQADPLLISEIPRTAPHVSIAAANFVDEIIIDRTNSESLKFNPTAISKLQRVLFADGPSIFSYAIGSPLSRTDPSGLAGIQGYEDMSAHDFIGDFCKGSVLRVFPGEYLDCSIGVIQ